MHRAALIALLAAETALAHPQHGAGGWISADLWHLLSEPDHLAAILLPLVIAGAIVLYRRRARGRRSRRE
jgi:hydrogenase/urease accessory protein HupE